MNVEEFNNLHDAIQILKKKSLTDDEEVYKMIATVAGIGAMKTMLSKYLPKGTVIIGTGNLPEMYNLDKPIVNNQEVESWGILRRLTLAMNGNYSRPR